MQKLHNGELHNSYSSLKIYTTIKSKQVGHTDYIEKDDKIHKFWSESLKRPLERPRPNWKNNTEVYLKEIVWTQFHRLNTGSSCTPVTKAMNFEIP